MLTGSSTSAKTIGTTDDTCFAATAAFPPVTMTSTLSRTNSAAISAKRSLRASAQRYSIARLRPSIQPSSCSRCPKAAVHGPQAEAVFGPKKPMVWRPRARFAALSACHQGARKSLGRPEVSESGWGQSIPSSPITLEINDSTSPCCGGLSRQRRSHHRGRKQWPR
jgi:hypothetical protein